MPGAGPRRSTRSTGRFGVTSASVDAYSGALVTRGRGNRMAESGEALGADLYSLLQVANTFLPILSDIYTDAKQGVVAARSSLEHVMARPAYFGGGTYGPIYQPWADLEAQTIKIVDEMISDL